MVRLALLLLLGGCALNPFDTSYLPPGPPLSVEGPAVVAVIDVADTPEVVADAFRASLAARSLLAHGKPRYFLAASMRPGVKMHVTLSDVAGHTVYADDVSVGHTLREAADNAIDKPAFRAAAAAG